MRLVRGIRNQAMACAAAVVLSSTAAGAQPATPPAAGRYEVVTGTICSGDAGGGTYDLLTGVGHAIRVLHLRLAAGVTVTGRGARAGVASLVPGAVCRFECRTEPAGTTASRVEVLEPAPGQRP